jgi:hypothetical protein
MRGSASNIVTPHPARLSPVHLLPQGEKVVPGKDYVALTAFGLLERIQNVRVIVYQREPAG